LRYRVILTGQSQAFDRQLSALPDTVFIGNGGLLIIKLPADLDQQFGYP